MYVWCSAKDFEMDGLHTYKLSSKRSSSLHAPDLNIWAVSFSETIQSGVWQETDLLVLCWRILKKIWDNIISVFFCQRKVITIRYHIITSSHHLISPEEWSLPFRNGWTSNLAASDLSQYHYWGRGPWWQWGGEKWALIFCYETNEKIKLMIMFQITNET